MALDKELVEEIKAKADIVDVISSYIPLSKKGRNYWAVCPFHDDHNPSLSVSKEKNMFNCFVCGTAGDVFSFVSRFDNITYSEAVRKVAEMINFDDPRLHQSSFEIHVDESIATLYRCITELSTFYSYSLRTEEGSAALTYLNNRGIYDDQIERFSLGYSPSDGKIPITYLTQKKFSLKNIEDIGISLVKTSNMKDNNAGRLIFPIKNANGQVVGFSARRLNDDSDEPKYVNSPETKIFVKGSILYNLDNAKQTMKKDGYLYVVEGFLDVFALDKIGEHSVVGLMGTALSKQNLTALRRANVEIRLCLDNDKAGQKSMMEFIPELNKEGISYRIVSMPSEKYKDADEILHKEGEDQLRRYISSLEDSFIFALNYYENTSPLGSTKDKIKVINHFTPMLLSINDKLLLEDRIAKLAKVTGFEVSAIKSMLKDARKALKKGPATVDVTYGDDLREETRSALSRLEKAERLVLSGMLSKRQVSQFYLDEVKYFTNDVYRAIANLVIDHLSNHEDIDATDLITVLELSDMPDKDNLIKEIASLSRINKEDNDFELSSLKDALEVIKDERKKTYNKDMLKKAQEGKDPREKARLLDEYIKRTNDEEDD